MVTSVTNLGRSGVSDWLIQRVSAVVLLIYVLFLVARVAGAEGLTYAEWRNLFDQPWMRAFTLVAVLSLCAHAWIGMWTIATDYLTPLALGSKATAVRLVFQLACLLVLAAYFIWSVQILWSN